MRAWTRYGLAKKWNIRGNGSEHLDTRIRLEMGDCTLLNCRSTDQAPTWEHCSIWCTAHGLVAVCGMKVLLDVFTNTIFFMWSPVKEIQRNHQQFQECLNNEGSSEGLDLHHSRKVHSQLRVGVTAQNIGRSQTRVWSREGTQHDLARRTKTSSTQTRRVWGNVYILGRRAPCQSNDWVDGHRYSHHRIIIVVEYGQKECLWNILRTISPCRLDRSDKRGIKDNVEYLSSLYITLSYARLVSWMWQLSRNLGKAVMGHIGLSFPLGENVIRVVSKWLARWTWLDESCVDLCTWTRIWSQLQRNSYMVRSFL